MPAVFDRGGLTFQYPDNWRLDEDGSDGGTSVTVESPGGAIWCISEIPPGTTLMAGADAALAAMKQEYDDVEFEPASEVFQGAEMVGYDVDLVYVDLTVTTRIRAFHRGSGAYLVHWQAEDRELEEIGPVFDAMLASLIGSLPKESE